MNLRRLCQFRLSTIFWLTICVASFFGGRYWDEIAKKSAPIIVASRITPLFAPPGTTSLQLTAGAATVVRSGVPINRILVADPMLVRIVPISQNSFQVIAKQSGKTKINIWGEVPNQTASYDVTVQ
jgi:Flp pilus assembly secretin CpaC